MKILHIDPTTKNIDEFNNYVNEDKKIFVLFYMDGCGPCNATRPEWEKIENALSKYKNNDDIVVADIDQKLLEKIKNLSSQPKGFPTMRYIYDRGKKSEDYEDSSIQKKDRTIDSFVNWIDSKMKKQQDGGRKSNKSKKCRKYNKSKKSKKCRKYNKQNRKTKRRL
jgi:thiol-disulfide isomerase/thioredoxin